MFSANGWEETVQVVASPQQYKQWGKERVVCSHPGITTNRNPSRWTYCLQDGLFFFFPPLEMSMGAPVSSSQPVLLTWILTLIGLLPCLYTLTRNKPFEDTGQCIFMLSSVPKELKWNYSIFFFFSFVHIRSFLNQIIIKLPTSCHVGV